MEGRGHITELLSVSQLTSSECRIASSWTTIFLAAWPRSWEPDGNRSAQTHVLMQHGKRERVCFLSAVDMGRFCRRGPNLKVFRRPQRPFPVTSWLREPFRTWRVRAITSTLHEPTLSDNKPLTDWPNRGWDSADAIFGLGERRRAARVKRDVNALRFQRRVDG